MFFKILIIFFIGIDNCLENLNYYYENMTF